MGADIPRSMRAVYETHVIWNMRSDAASVEAKEKNARAELDTGNDTGACSCRVVYATGVAVVDEVIAIDGVEDGVAGTSLQIIDTSQDDDDDAASTVMFKRYAAEAPRKPAMPIDILSVAGLDGAIPDADVTGATALLGGKK